MFKGLKSIFSAIGKDKYIHFLVSLILVQSIYIIGSLCKLGIYSVIPAIVIALAVGILKEKHDSKGSGTFDNYDIVADFLGVFLGVVFISLFNI